MKADGSILIDTKILDGGMEKGFEVLKNEMASVGLTAKEVGEEIEVSFSKMDVSKTLANSIEKIEALEQQLAAVTSDFDVAISHDDDKAAERLAAKRTALYDRLELARKKLATEIADAVKKEAKAEEKAAQRAIKAAQREAKEEERAAERSIKAAEKEAKAKEKAAQKQLKAATKPVRYFNSRLMEILSGALIFNAIGSAVREMTSYFGEALNTNEEYRQSFARLKGALLTAFQPIYEYVLPAIITLMNWLTAAIQVVGQFFASLTGKSYSDMQKNAEALYEQSQALKDVGDSAEEASKQLMGFDEINRLSETIAGATSGLNGEIIEAPVFGEIEIPSEWETAIESLTARIRDIFFDWEDLTPEQIAQKLLTALTTIAGGLIGFALGGPGGALIGMTFGAVLGVVLSNIIFDGDGNLSPEELASALVTALGIGVIGFALGGPMGALIGVTIGAVATISLSEILFNGDGTISADEILAGLVSAINIIGGGLIGFAIGGGGGALIGATIGLALTFGILETSFDDVEKSYDDLAENVLEWSDLAARTTEEGFIMPSHKDMLWLRDRIKEYFNEVKDNIVENFDLAARTTEQGFVLPTHEDMLQLRDKIKEYFANAADNIVSDFNYAARTTEQGFTIPTREEFAATAEWIAEKFTEAKDWIIDGWKYVSDWFSKDVIKPLSDGFKNMVNNVIGLINSMISSVIDGINAAVSAINKMDFTVPDWVPGIGGKSFRFNLGYINTYPQIPYLAQGAVIPPNAPFMAVLGDQRNGTNIEAPADLIRQIVREELGNGASNDKTAELLRELIGVVQNISVGDETIGRAAARYNRRASRAGGY